jgi:predicted alpha-1,2-mannosidase
MERNGTTYAVVATMIWGMTGIVATAQQANPAASLVNPFVGTGGHGHTFPGACVPNGLVQLSPDTRPDGYNDWDGCGGYHYSDSVIYGFSHTHLSGTGVADLCDVLLMPMRGFHSSDPVDYRSTFRKETEQAHAGYYSVHLDRPDLRAELTATEHVGVHRYGMPPSQDLYLVIDLRHRDQLLGASFTLTANNEVEGHRRSASWARDQQLFFVMRFSKPITIVDADHADAAVMVRNDGTPLIVKVGISAVSIEGARKNLDAEVPHWDFDQVRAEAEAAWNAKLNKVKITGGTREQQRIFYTALYHSYVAPYIFNDVDGNYRGMDGEVHHADHKVYTVFSLWDTFRGLHPLMTILEPEMTKDWIKTFLAHYLQSGRLPVWELWGNETDCMIGYHSASVIADAQMKGIRGFDEQLALEAMREGARMRHFGLGAFWEKGFISSEDGAESVSRTLEYAYDDACIAAFESRLEQRGSDQGRLSFRERSGNWQNLFDPGTGFFRARRNGGFAPGFDPYEVNFNFTEANAWQYSLFVPHDIEGLIDAHGGPAKFEAHLDALFAAKTPTSGREQADITGLIGQYAHGNEPSHHMAYLYDRVGKPEKTRAMVKRIMEEFYHDAPDGLIGNEDCGQMSAWYVLSALGFYPIAPGTDSHYDLGYPLFDEARIQLPKGRTWTMRIADEAEWKRTVPLDTTTYRGFVPKDISHYQLMEGGAYLFAPDRIPRRCYQPKHPMTVLDGAYVRDPKVRPGAPVIQAPSMTFTDMLELTVEGRGTCTMTDASGTRSCPMNAPFTIAATAEVSVEWSDVYAPVTGHFTKIDGSRTIALESTYANQYCAGGDKALIDGLRGGTDFRTGEWQGFQGQDLVAMIDLGEVKKLKRVGLSALQDQRSWIFLPQEVTLSWSTNKRQWSSRTITHAVDARAEGGQLHEFLTEELDTKARYISVVAKSAGPCPDWHPGKGGKTWIFADEVLIGTE